MFSRDEQSLNCLRFVATKVASLKKDFHRVFLPIAKRDVGSPITSVVIGAMPPLRLILNPLYLNFRLPMRSPKSRGREFFVDL